jgi:AcrR family transcriptional regulator
MSIEKPTNQRVEQGKATRERIVATARKLLAAKGYAGMSIEDVLDDTSISRGALYHHFNSKEALFEAVLEAMEAEIAQIMGKAAIGLTDPVEALRAAWEAWFKLARDPAVRQIVLTDALSVVGWEKWREIDERYGFGRLKRTLQRAAAAGRMQEDLVDTFAHILLAAIFEVGLLIARAEDPEAATATARAAVNHLLDRLLAQPSAAR